MNCDFEELFEITNDLKALTSLLYALSDAEPGGFIVDGTTLNFLGKLAADCNNRLKKLFPISE